MSEVSLQEQALLRRFTERPQQEHTARDDHDWQVLMDWPGVGKCSLTLAVIASHALDPNSKFYERAHHWLNEQTDCITCTDAVFLYEAQLSAETRKLVWEQYIDRYDRQHKIAPSANILFKRMRDGERFNWNKITKSCEAGSIGEMPPENRADIFDACRRLMNDPREADIPTLVEHFTASPQIGSWDQVRRRIVELSIDHRDVLAIVTGMPDLFCDEIIWCIGKSGFNGHAYAESEIQAYSQLVQSVVNLTDTQEAEQAHRSTRELVGLVSQRNWLRVDRIGLINRSISQKIASGNSSDDYIISVSGGFIPRNPEFTAFIREQKPAVAAQIIMIHAHSLFKSNNLSGQIAELVEQNPEEYKKAFKRHIHDIDSETICEFLGIFGAENVKDILEEWLRTCVVDWGSSKSLVESFRTKVVNLGIRAGTLLSCNPVLLCDLGYELTCDEIYQVLPYNELWLHQQQYPQWASTFHRALQESHSSTELIIQSLCLAAERAYNGLTQEDDNRRHEWFKSRLLPGYENGPQSVFDAICSVGWGEEELESVLRHQGQPVGDPRRHARWLSVQPSVRQYCADTEDGDDLICSYTSYPDQLLTLMQYEPDVCDALWTGEEQLDKFFRIASRAAHRLYWPQPFERLFSDDKSKTRLRGWLKTHESKLGAVVTLKWLIHYNLVDIAQARRIARQLLDSYNNDDVDLALEVLDKDTKN